MIDCRLDIDGVTARRDLSGGRFEIVVGEAAYRLREWTWGERRRLLAACSDGARLDAAAFVDGMVGLLVDPEPAAEWKPVLAHVALKLLGVDGQRRAVPLVAAERALARAYGWTPSLLDGEAAGALDRMVEGLGTAPPAPPAPPAPDDGWTRIVVDDG